MAALPGLRLVSAIVALAALQRGSAAAADQLPPAPDSHRTAARYSWELPHANVAATGGLEWSPAPFVFEAGASRRFIDFEHGNDASDGRSPATPWKHHPWDRQPAAVVQVAFVEWTRAGLLRHPTFRGIRHDKNAAAVRKEVDE